MRDTGDERLFDAPHCYASRGRAKGVAISKRQRECVWSRFAPTAGARSGNPGPPAVVSCDELNPHLRMGSVAFMTTGDMRGRCAWRVASFGATA